MCQILINSVNVFDFRTILGLTGGKYFKKIIFDIICAINNWLYVNEPLYIDTLF